MHLVNEWYYFNNAIDDKTCKKIIRLGSGKFEDATVGQQEEKVVSRSTRTSSVYFSNDQWLYDLIWPYMLEANELSGWKFDVKYCESVQVTKYKKGQFYNWHKDGHSDNLSSYDMPNNGYMHGNVRKLSMTILLNDKYDGGSFQFANYVAGNAGITDPGISSLGSIIVFPSFVEHRVNPVTKGVRYSLVSWFLGPPFK